MDDDFMAMGAAAASLKKLFDSYRAAGFTEDQALKLCILVVMYIPPTSP